MRMSGWGVCVGGNPTFYVTVSGGSVTKNPSANGGDVGLTPGSGRSPGAGNGNPLQYFWLGGPMEEQAPRGAWWAEVHGAAKSQMWLSDSPRVRTQHTHIPVQPLSTESCLFVTTPNSSVLSPTPLRCRDEGLPYGELLLWSEETVENAIPVTTSKGRINRIKCRVMGTNDASQTDMSKFNLIPSLSHSPHHTQTCSQKVSHRE